MHTGFTGEEMSTLQEVIKEYLTELRAEIEESEEGQLRERLKTKKEILSGILAKIERSKVVSLN